MTNYDSESKNIHCAAAPIPHRAQARDKYRVEGGLGGPLNSYVCGQADGTERAVGRHCIGHRSIANRAFARHAALHRITCLAIRLPCLAGDREVDFTGIRIIGFLRRDEGCGRAGEGGCPR